MLYLRAAVNFYDYLVARKDLCFGMLRMCGVGLRLRSTAASSKVCGVEGGNGCMLEWRGLSVCTYLASLGSRRTKLCPDHDPRVSQPVA